MTFYEITDSDRELIKLAMEQLQACFDDGVYHHTVGAAVRAKSGEVYTGVNMFAIHGSCAEFVALGKAITAGEKEMDTIVATHDFALNNVLSPCGNCRQLMIEYYPNIKVILNNDEGELVKVYIKDLIPFAWMPVEIPD